jgi:hypothetical protein
MNFGKLSSADIRLFLNYFPLLSSQFEEAEASLHEDSDLLFAPNAEKPVWCYYYEKPIKEHLALVLHAFGSLDLLKSLGDAPNQITALPELLDAFQRDLDAYEPTEEEAVILRKRAALVYGLSYSVYCSLRSLQTFGLYLNDLIACVRAGGKTGDKALLQAVKIDPTVLACPSVATRISQAVLLKEMKFLRNVQLAMSGKLTKREQRNYQNMRITLQILHETGAQKLSEPALYELFVEELKLFAGEHSSDEGNVANNLRQFAYQFIKQKSVS